MKKLSTFSLIAAVIFCILAVLSFFVGEEGLGLYLPIRFLGHMLILIIFVCMLFSKSHRWTSVLGIMAGLCGCASVLLFSAFIKAEQSEVAIKLTNGSRILETLNIVLIFISGFLLYAEFRNNKKYRLFARLAVISYLFIKAVIPAFFVLVCTPKDMSQFEDLMHLRDVLPTVAFYCLCFLYLMALSFALDQKNSEAQPGAEV